jgi:transcription elongation factor SPT6
LQDAQDIFGVDFDYDEMEQMDAEAAGEEGEEEAVEEEEEYEDEDEYDREGDDEEDEDGEARPRRPKKGGRVRKPVRKKVAKQSIFELYEPAELERGHFTDVDNNIRITDIPERMQTRSIPVVPISVSSSS